MANAAAAALRKRIEALGAEGRFDEARGAFEALCALDVAEEDVRAALAAAGADLAYELALTKADRRAAEAVYARLRQILERFPDDYELVGLAAASAAALAGACAREKDWPAACNYATAINRLNDDVPAKLSAELDLQYGRASCTTILALVQDDEWWHARRLTYMLRELLLSDVMLTDLAQQRGGLVANDMKGLFEAMVEAFREAEPELAREIDAEAAERKGAPVEEPERGERGRVEALYDFEILKDITIYGFVSLRVPARWPEARADGGRGGFWEEGVESGTLWIDWDVYTMKGQRPRQGDPSVIRVADAGDRSVSYRRTEAVEKGETLVIHNWLVSCGRPGLALMVHFNLVLLADLAERNDFRPLPKLIDREIRAARIDLDRIPRGAK
jgi:tetratricopeptide (TPR) repeat protein